MPAVPRRGDDNLHVWTPALLLYPALCVGSDCTLPATLDARQFINLSDPLHRPDNPNAGPMVQVNFAADHYVLDILGTAVHVQGSYRYQRHAPHLGDIRMREAFPGGTTASTLLLTCLTDNEGMFVLTQHAGPIAPARQNSGRWTLTPWQEQPPMRWLHTPAGFPTPARRHARRVKPPQQHSVAAPGRPTRPWSARE